MIASVVTVAFLHSFRIPESSIQKRLLKETPLGTSATQVIAVVKDKFSGRAWKVPQHNSKWGASKEFLHPKNSDYVGSRNVQIIVGARSISDVHLGSYWTVVPLFPMKTHVFASWAFNDDDKLIEIIVEKEVDAP